MPGVSTMYRAIHSQQPEERGDPVGKTNSLQAMLDRAKMAPAQERPNDTQKAQGPEPARQAARGRAATTLVGGHFAPEVGMQLRMLAAEERTTIQKLLAEAIDDLLVKKGKRRVAVAD